MRVVAGEARGLKLLAPDGVDTRPTSDRVREAIFNSLASMGVLNEAVVVDLFAGSGALGIEALSRHAERCTFVERARPALDVIRANLAATKLADRADVVIGDAMVYLAQGRAAQADLILADPPYLFDEWPALLAAVPNALVVAESDRIVAAPEGWASLKERRYGRTWVTILERVGGPDADAT
jgi:16S rRNA (guanine966-N2)-methyltransferase